MINASSTLFGSYPFTLSFVPKKITTIFGVPLSSNVFNLDSDCPAEFPLPYAHEPLQELFTPSFNPNPLYV